MNTPVVQADLSLWHTLRTRRNHEVQLRGLDAMAFRWGSRIKHARVGLKYLQAEADAVVAMERQWSSLSNEQLDEQTLAIREVFARRQYEPQDVRTALAAVREIAHREMGMRPYPVQIMGALGMFHGQIVEMVTGEGKTLTACVAACLLGWLRRPVHVVTVNDYLAQRDATEYRPIYQRAGLGSGAILGDTEQHERATLYRTPVVYTTQKELVADWLRDQLRMGRIADPVSTRWRLSTDRDPQALAGAILVPGLHVAIIDELDSVLIDEAVTPLIIAQPRGADAQADVYRRARELAMQLQVKADFKVDAKDRHVKLTDAGRAKLASLLSDQEQAIWHARRRREELVAQALVAEHCYVRGQHYQIVEDQVVIVDEFTGRFMPDRQWQHGLHQAVEAKSNVEITEDRDTLASLSFQRFFKQYPHLCGMTGTAADAKAELETTYGLPVRVVPTNRPIRREAWPQHVYANAQLKWKAVADEVEREHAKGRPVLVGTRSIEASEFLSELLSKRGLKEHQVLNAVHHRAEAQIIAHAGEMGAITVATNMAGRGTDVKLGKGIAERGGLHVILTERHTASRIDRQLIGRSGRQGDPGSSHAIVSLEDELIIKYAPGIGTLLRRRFADHQEPLPKWVDRVFRMAQWVAQRDAFKSRAATLKHEETLDESLPI